MNIQKFKEIQKYFEAWWNCECLDKVPIFIKLTKTNQSDRSSLEDYIKKEPILNKFEKELANTFYGGVAFPMFWPNLGPDIFSGYFGAKINFTPSHHNTVSWADWKTPVLKDYKEIEKVLYISEENFWWKLTKQLTEYAIERSKGRYFVGITDIHSGMDALSVLRGGPEVVCMDLIDNPEGVKKAMKYIWEAWYKVYNTLYEIISKKQKGSTSWIHIFSPGKMYPLQNDFTCLISPMMYKEFFLEEIVNQIEYLDHSIYHLDGPDALKHLDMLLELSKLNAIQWVPGAGNEGVKKWIDVYKRIQKARKSIIVYCTPEEIELALKELSPEGLLLSVSCKNKEEAKKILEKWFYNF